MTHAFLTKAIRKLGYMLAAVIILAALLVSIARLLTPVLNGHRAEFEKLASAKLQMPVMISEVSLAWHGLMPQISLEHVTLLDPSNNKPKLKIAQIEMDFSIWQSLLKQQAFIENMTVSGVSLTITKQASGQFNVGNFTAFNMQDSLTGSSVQTDAVFAWVFSQPRLELQDIQVRYISPAQGERSVTLKTLSLNNTETHHVLNGKATLNQELPTKITIHLGWDGDVRKVAEAKGHIHLNVEGLSLPQWFSQMTWAGFQVKKGLANANIWVGWHDNKVQTMRVTLEAFSINLYSSVRQKIEKIDRINAIIGWRRDGRLQRLAGDKISIDFPDHLWPATHFFVKAEEQDNGNISLKSIRVSYLNLVDLKRLALASSLLPDNIRQMIVAIDPKGEITDLQSILPLLSTDMTHLSLSAAFSGLTANEWQSYPGMMNLNGYLAWNGKKADLVINSDKTAFTLHQFFAKPLYFAQVRGHLQLEKDNQGAWSLQTKNMSIVNADLTANADLTVVMPQNDSPQVDLSAQFTIANAGHIINYLPVKVFEPNLTEWLRAAFISGRIESGVATFQGRLKDFPFADHSGKSLITTKLRDLDFHFAPGWPHLLHTNGDLTFVGDSIIVDVRSAQLLGVPITNMHGLIPPLLADAPSYVAVKGVVQTDLAQGLRLIQESPLQKTIGKELIGMNLVGPMQLKIDLTVPFRKPEDAAVVGNVTVSDAMLALPDWKLKLEHMNGAFQFTENSLEANNLQGKLFSEPTTLKLTTLHEKGQKGQVRADLTSKITMTALQDWLAVPITKVAQGAALYQTQLFLTSDAMSSGDRILIKSDLNGIALTLPAPYGKTANTLRDLHVDINTNETKSVKIKLNLAKLISAAMQFEKSKQSLDLLGGELRLGGQEATWQSRPGMIVTGRMEKIDVDLWQRYFATLKDNTTPTSRPNLQLLRGIDLSTPVLHGWNMQFHDAQLQASQSEKSWQLNMKSKELTGKFTIPVDLSTQPIQGQLQSLTLYPQKGGFAIDPRTIPALSLSIDALRYDDIKLGRVRLNVSPTKSGLLINELSLEQPLKLNATGNWLSTGTNRYQTNIKGNIVTSSVSNVLNEWGMQSSNLVGSTGQARFDLSWPDAPYRFSMTNLSGDVSLQLGEGRIIELSQSSNAKIDLGRLLNLFSLSTIPRRLSLDFSDLVEKGYSFDFMKGDYRLKGGSAFTNNMHFEGPIAGVGISGRIGFQAKDVDIKLSVTPHVTGSLPVVAAIAGGPIVGVAALVVDKVMSSAMSSVATYQYSVTGSWNNPAWQQVQSRPVAHDNSR